MISRLPFGRGNSVKSRVDIMVIQPLPILGDALKAHPKTLGHSAAGDVVGGRLEHEAVEAEVVKAVLH